MGLRNVSSRVEGVMCAFENCSTEVWQREDAGGLG